MAGPITLSAAMSLDNAVLVLAASKASGASDLGVLGVYQWAFSSCMDHQGQRPTREGIDIAVFSRRHLCSCHAVHNFFRKNRPLSLQQYVAGVKLFLVSLIPVRKK